MITLKACPLCGSKDVKPYGWAGVSPRTFDFEIMPGVLVNASVVTRYSLCSECLLVFQNPRFSESELEKYYSEGHYRRMHHVSIKEADEGERLRAKKNAQIIRGYASNIGSHLDIGSSRGFFLSEVAAKEQVGVDLNTGYVQFPQIKIYRSMANLKKKSFDLVSAIHVLEHISKPVDYLKKMVELVKDDGYMLVEVPMGDDDKGSLDLAHLYHFEPAVIRRLCVQAGMQIIHEEFTPHLLLVCKIAKN